MLSDGIMGFGNDITQEALRILASGCLTPAHATQFTAYVRQVRNQYSLKKILNGEQKLPDKPEDRDVLYFLAQSLRARLVKELPENRGKLNRESRELAECSKNLLVDIAGISLEIAQMTVTPDDVGTLPAWFLVDSARSIPELTKRKRG